MSTAQKRTAPEDHHHHHGDSAAAATEVSASAAKKARSSEHRRRVVIVGGIGFDFHVFNRVFRGHPEYNVVAFTMAAEQNMGTTEEGAKPVAVVPCEGKSEASLIPCTRRYPATLAGADLYPDGIPMVPEGVLAEFVKVHHIDEVVFAYSDCSHEEVMHKASKALAAGADYRLIAPRNTMVKSRVPVVAVCAVRTGCGKSQVSRAVCRQLREKYGLRVVAIREPMPYGDLDTQNVMRFAAYEDFERFGCTVEEREEYEPYIEQGLVIYSGVDYEKIVRLAEQECDVLVWDGGNNEISFVEPDLLCTIADPLRVGHELRYHPGEVNVRLADLFVVNKVNSAHSSEDVAKVEAALRGANAHAQLIRTDSVVTLHPKAATPAHPEAAPLEVRAGMKAIVVEDGPTVTHGEMSYGAGLVAARAAGLQIIDPRPFLRGCMTGIFQHFPHLHDVLPAMGYNAQQLADLCATLEASDADVVINGSPSDISRLMPQCKKPIARVVYDIADRADSESLASVIDAFIAKHVPDAVAK